MTKGSDTSFETSFETAPSEDGGSVVPPPSNPMGVARTFLDENYADERVARLAHHRGLFYTWEGTHWIEAESRAVRANLYTALEHALYLKGDPPELTPFEPTRMKIANVVEALAALVHLSEHVDPPAWFDETGRWPAEDIVAMENGLLRLSTRELHPHTPAFFNQHRLPFAYDPDAPDPARWDRFLRELWEDDQESIDTLAEAMGYILGGGTAQQKIFMIVGPKRAGKGTILRVLAALLGPENIAAPTLSSLAMNFGLQPLVGKPLAAISEARIGTRSDALVAVERLLSISGEDSITIDRKYKDPWTGRLPTRFVILTNEIPRFTDASGALASRFVIFPLTRSFYGCENPRLTEELLNEAPGIFNWCLTGLDRLVERGHFVQPEAAASALRHLEDLASPVSAFVRDRCVVGPAFVAAKDELWIAWKAWCESEGAKSGTRAVFVRDLRAAVPGAVPKRLREGETRLNVIAGLALSKLEEQWMGPLTTPDQDGVGQGSVPTDSDRDPFIHAGGQGWSGVEPIVAPTIDEDDDVVHDLLEGTL